jgi:RHS repeat-associated protein
VFFRETLMRSRPRRLALAVAFTTAVFVIPSVAGAKDRPSPDTTSSMEAQAAPVPSGADPSYPSNHTLDEKLEALGSVTNADFEAAPRTVGTPPANSTLEASPVTVATVPNGDFQTGNFSNWTLTSSPSIASDQTHGYWARFTAKGQAITSSAVAIPSSAQALVYDVYYQSTTGTSRVDVYVLSGATFGTSTLVKSDSCSKCGRWSTSYVDLTSWRGQTIKFKFSAYSAPVGIDNVKVQQVFPSFDVSGEYIRDVSGGDTSARVKSGGWLTTSAFTVNASAQYGTVELIQSSTNGQYDISIATGPGFSTFTSVASGVAPTTWQQIRFGLYAYAGQQVKVRVKCVYGWISIDDITGTQVVEIPSWDVTRTTSRITDGANHYTRTNGTLTSTPVTLSSGIQQLSLRIRSEGTGSSAYVELLRGADFATVVYLDYVAPGSSWATLKYSVSPYVGETVKLRVRGYSGTINLDDAGLVESVLPGWTPTTTDAIKTATDAYGTYVAPFKAGGAMFLRSGWISPGIVDASAYAEARYYAVSYDIGYATGSVIQVFWVDEAGSSLTAFQDASNSPTGYRTRYFPVYDFMGQRGRFVVKTTGGGKAYSIGDNVARQQLSEPFTRKVGLGIDTSTGTVTFAEQDISIPGAIPLAFARYYNAHSDRLGSLGFRWSNTYDTRLAFAGDDVGVVFGSGREEFFDKQTNGTYKPSDPRIHSMLVKNGDGTYSLTTKDNLTYDFTSAGALNRVRDLNGYTLQLSYDAQGRVSGVAAPGGASLGLSYDAQGRIARVTDPAGSAWVFAYDAAGDLVSVTDPTGGVRTYAYSRHRLTSVTDQAGHLVVANTYDDVHRVTSQTDALGKTISIAYASPGKGATQVTFPGGGVATFYFDRFQRTTDATDPTGRTTSYLYDPNGNLDKVIDSGNAAWDYAFDASGDLTGASDPLGNPTSFAYNPKHLPTSITDGRGNVTTLTYDTKGNLTSTTNPLGKTWTFSYDAGGNMTSSRDPLARTTTYGYDARGYRTSKTDALGKTWSYTYTSTGKLRTETDPLGNTTTYGYDLLGRLIYVRDPLGRQTDFLYDAVGHLLRVADPLGNATSWAYDDRGLVRSKTDAAGKVTTHTYDADRNMTSLTDPLGRTTSYAFDSANRLTSVTDPLGNRTRYTYDAAGRLASKIDALGRVTAYGYDSAGRLAQETLPNAAVIAYTYDGAGNLVSVTNELGNAATYAYDAANQLTSTTDPLSHTTAYAYDAAGQLSSVTDPLSRTTTYTYDAAGRLASTRDALGNASTYGYDAAGRRITVTDATSRITTYGYDAAGQVTSVTDPAGNRTTSAYDLGGRLTSVVEPSGATTTYAYDPRGLVSSVTDPLLKATAYGYDAAGQLKTETDPLNHATTYGYDAAGRMTSITDALGGQVVLGYDAAGQLTSITDPRNKTWSYTYNALGMRTGATDPLGRSTSYGYDAAGQLTSTTDARGIVTSYGYDASQQMTSLTYPGGSVGYAYDAAGQRTAMTDPTGTTSYGYDAAGQLTNVSSPRGAMTYGYDAAGRRSRMTLPSARAISYAYDTAGRLQSLTDWLGRPITFTYDADGNRTQISRPNGVSSTYAYDAAGRVSIIAHRKGAQGLSSFTYTYDAAGNRTSVTATDGTETYSYDALDRLTTVQYPGGASTSFTYDAAGNRLTQNRNGTLTTYTYDAAGELLTAGSRTYAYDPNGNMTSAGQDRFTYDAANRLTSASVGSHTATYTFDGEGNLVRRAVDGVSSSFLVDAASGLPTIVDDGSRAYLHAGGDLAEIGSTTRYPLADALGSVRALTDASGAVVGTASYEAFGALRSSSGEASTFGFTGEPSDATGLIYLRARFVDPFIGRFLSPDTVVPNAPGTQGYGLYAYAADNPATWTDPSGHQAVAVPATPSVWASILIAVQAVCLAAGSCGLALAIVLVLLTAACMLNQECAYLLNSAVETGARTFEGVIDWTIDRLLDAARDFPPIPFSVAVEVPTVVASEATRSAGSAQRRVVIGENSEVRPDRIELAARHVGAEWFTPEYSTKDRSEQFALNWEWIEQVMADRAIIYDLGIAPERPIRSEFYIMEKVATAGYPLVFPYPDPAFY